MNLNIYEFIEYPKNGINSKELFENEGVATDLFCMAAGSKMGEHTSTKQGLIYVLEGNGTFNLEGKSIEMIPGVLIHMKKNAVHSLKAEKNTSFLLTLIE